MSVESKQRQPGKTSNPHQEQAVLSHQSCGTVCVCIWFVIVVVEKYLVAM